MTEAELEKELLKLKKYRQKLEWIAKMPINFSGSGQGYILALEIIREVRKTLKED